jgi:hypothetical protein
MSHCGLRALSAGGANVQAPLYGNGALYRQVRIALLRVRGLFLP